MTTRRKFLAAAAVATAWSGACPNGSRFLAQAAQKSDARAQIAITLDLEMSAQYPRRDLLEWNYEKGNLDEPTKRYSVEAAKIVREYGGRIHFFCVGRVLEQPDVGSSRVDLQACKLEYSIVSPK